MLVSFTYTKSAEEPDIPERFQPSPFTLAGIARPGVAGAFDAFGPLSPLAESKAEPSFQSLQPPPIASVAPTQANEYTITPMSGRSRSTDTMEISIESYNCRASSTESTGVLPFLITILGPQFEATGFTSTACPSTRI